MTHDDNWEVAPTGTVKTLDEKDVQIEELKDCLRYIVNMESCLLAHAQEVARNMLEKYK